MTTIGTYPPLSHAKLSPMIYPASIFALLIAAIFAIPVSTREDDPLKPFSQIAVDFNRDVKPIFAKHCISCHGTEKQKNGSERSTGKGDALKGGDSGAVAIVPRGQIRR